MLGVGLEDAGPGTLPVRLTVLSSALKRSVLARIRATSSRLSTADNVLARLGNGRLQNRCCSGWV